MWTALTTRGEASARLQALSVLAEGSIYVFVQVVKVLLYVLVSMHVCVNVCAYGCVCHNQASRRVALCVVETLAAASCKVCNVCRRVCRCVACLCQQVCSVACC